MATVQTWWYDTGAAAYEKTRNLWIWSSGAWQVVHKMWIHNGSSFVLCFDDTPGPLDHIIVTPGTATVAEGGTQAFTAAGFDIDGRAVSIGSPTWSVDDHSCTIDGGGLFTAGLTSATVTVTAASAGIGGTAVVTVP